MFTPRLRSLCSRHVCSVPGRSHSTSPSPRPAKAVLTWLVVGTGVSLTVWWEIRTRRCALDSSTLSRPHSHPQSPGDPSESYISVKEVAKHNSSQDAWVIINGKVYDVTHFHEHHPGGAAVIVSNAGTDASEIFNSLHPPGTIENHSPPECLKGRIDPVALAKANAAQEAEKQRTLAARNASPPVETILGSDEFEGAAEAVMSEKSAEYYRGGALDGISKDDNKSSFKKCRLVPRVMRDVSTIAPQTTLFGLPSALPVYISPASNAVSGHPDGELNSTRAAAKTGIVQGVSYVASYPLVDILDAKADQDEREGEPMGMVYQVYVRPDRVKTEEMIRTAIDGGCRASSVTVDSNIGDFRQSVEKLKGTTGDAEPGRRMQPFTTFAPPHDPSLHWGDLDWSQGIAQDVPIYLKGVSSVEDVRIAHERGVKGCISSNHGGRQSDRARSGFDSSRRIHEQDPALSQKLEIYVDGGARRGTDVLMALALGARGVGLGRPFSFAQAAYGERGAIRAVRILEKEIVTAMQSLGVSRSDELRPEMVECSGEFWK